MRFDYLLPPRLVRLFGVCPKETVGIILRVRRRGLLWLYVPALLVSLSRGFLVRDRGRSD